MISSLLSRLVILVFGTLYPAYASYKAVKSKNVKEYVKWMMYWIVFALFTCAETLTDIFLSFWFPFYYEIKIVIVIWLLCPATKGSSIMYRNFVHPWLSCREQEIDEYIARAKEQSYTTVLQLGSKGFNYASNVIMQTALKGGGGLVSQLRRSYSLGDISVTDDSPVDKMMNRGDSVDSPSVSCRKPIKRTSNAGSQANLYFPAMDIDVDSIPVQESEVLLSNQVQSVEDISSGYCSSDSVFPVSSELQSDSPLTRSGSLGSSRVRTRALSGASKRTSSQDQELLEGGVSSDHLSNSSYFPSSSNISHSPDTQHIPYSSVPVHASQLLTLMKEQISSDLNTQIFSLNHFLQYHALCSQLIHDHSPYPPNSENTISSNNLDATKKARVVNSPSNSSTSNEVFKGENNSMDKEQFFEKFSLSSTSLPSLIDLRENNSFFQSNSTNFIDKSGELNFNKDKQPTKSGTYPRNEDTLSVSSCTNITDLSENHNLKKDNSSPLNCHKEYTRLNTKQTEIESQLKESASKKNINLSLEVSNCDSLTSIGIEVHKLTRSTPRKRSKKGPAPKPPVKTSNPGDGSELCSLVKPHCESGSSSVKENMNNSNSDKNSTFISLRGSNEDIKSCEGSQNNFKLCEQNPSVPILSTTEPESFCKSNEEIVGVDKTSANKAVMDNVTLECVPDHSAICEKILNISVGEVSSTDLAVDTFVENRNTLISEKSVMDNILKVSSSSVFGSLLKNKILLSYFYPASKDIEDGESSTNDSERNVENGTTYSEFNFDEAKLVSSQGLSEADLEDSVSHSIPTSDINQEISSGFRENLPNEKLDLKIEGSSTYQDRFKAVKDFVESLE